MYAHTLLVTALFAIAAAAHGKQADDKDAELAQRANVGAEKIVDAQAFLIEIDEALALAESGSYGRMPRGASNRLLKARNQIVELLEGHDSALELPPEERIDLFNAQETITAIIRNDDKSRIVCRRETHTGSRVPTTECLTVAQIEERGRASRNATDKLQTPGCVPAPGNASGCMR